MTGSLQIREAFTGIIMHPDNTQFQQEDLKGALRAAFGKPAYEELAAARSYFHEETLRKNEFFTRSGKVCDRLSIIRNGILRVYALSDGKEITQWIAVENSLMTEVTGFFFDQPNRWSIQALADTTLWTITKADYRKLCREFPEWNETEKGFLLKCFALLEDRVFSHLSMTAEERYRLYFEQNRPLFNQVPLQYIASVLGMTAETFSRIRKRQMENP